jgi:CRP-like cAMP-binding protein
MTHAEIAEMMGCSRRHIGDLMARFETEMESQRRLA